MAFTDSTVRQVTRIRADLAAITDEHTRDLTAAWVRAWNEVAPELNATVLELLVSGERLSRAKLLRSERLRQVLLVIRDHLDVLAEQAQVRIIGDLERVVDIAGGAQASVIDSQLPPGGSHLMDLQSWTKIDERAVEAIVTRSAEQITSRFRPLPRDADRALRAELIRGYAAGTNPRATAGRIVARANGRFNGGLTRALAIARTESLDAARAGATLGRSQHADVLAGWSWHCELSTRSCPACISMDGQIFPVDDPGPIDHVNGRCTGVPVTKSWAELGFDNIVEPAPVRDPGSVWFEQQSKATQVEILGPGKYAAWAAGDYPMDAWGAVRHNDGWRDSLQNTPIPARQSGGRRSAS